ncbi:MAG: glutamate-1-semialdehyde 2,1-aminomutase, partial [Persicimonas sp.]
FNGCYHGHADSFLIAAGSGATTLGVPNSPGVTKGTAKDTLLADFNDIESVERLIEQNNDEVAAVILEPVCGNTGCIPPKDNFLKDLRELCTKRDVALIMDEVMTGFRVAAGGAAERFEVEADIYCFGKVIGGGFPLAAYGGSEEIMRNMAPDGPVYQAGTLSGNPVAVAAGTATLEQLDETVYETLEARGSQLQEGLEQIIDELDVPLSTQRVGSMFSLFFDEGPIDDHDDVKECDLPRFNRFFHEMLRRGVYLAPSQFEAGFLATAHTPEIIDEVLDKTELSLREVY